MKGMDRIQRGSGFRGVLSYCIDHTDKESAGVIVGGNMSGSTVSELSAEFNAFRKLKPEIEKPVWHNSLRLPAGERLSSERWQSVADEYMRRMGFNDSHPRLYVLHDDKAGQHIHIVASRIDASGGLYLGQNENLKSTKLISELERDFKLTQTSTESTQRRKPKLKRGEIERAIRTNEPPAKLHIKNVIAAAVDTRPAPSASQFIERCAAGGVAAIPNIANTGKLNGFTFYDQKLGIHFKGSQVGFAARELQKSGVTYDKAREAKFLLAIRDQHRAATASAQHGTSATASAETSAGTTKREAPSNNKNSATAASPAPAQAAGNGLSSDKRANTNRTSNRIDLALKADAAAISNALRGKVKIRRHRSDIQRAKSQLRRNLSPASLLIGASAEVAFFLVRCIRAGLQTREQAALQQRVAALRSSIEQNYGRMPTPPLQDRLQRRISDHRDSLSISRDTLSTHGKRVEITRKPESPRDDYHLRVASRLAVVPDLAKLSERDVKAIELDSLQDMYTDKAANRFELQRLARDESISDIYDSDVRDAVERADKAATELDTFKKEEQEREKLAPALEVPRLL